MYVYIIITLKKKQITGTITAMFQLPAAVLTVSTSGQPVVTMVTSPPPQGSKGRSDEIPEYLAEDERRQSRTYRHVCVGGEEMTISMAVVQPYRAIIQHAGTCMCM